MAVTALGLICISTVAEYILWKGFQPQLVSARLRIRTKTKKRDFMRFHV
jgi:hypothetical protein